VTPDFQQLSITDLCRNFGRRRALVRVRLECTAGEIVGLLGPNGAGKSTLLSVVSTLLTPSSGEVRYGGRTASEAGPTLRGRLGLLSHDLHLYPELSAFENLTFFAQLYGLSNTPALVARALDRAGLGERRDDEVAGFSRGMRQRLALERALLHGPRLLLLDEPFTGLDDASAWALVDRLRELRADGRIILLATHDLDVAETVLDRAAVLKEGRLVAAGAVTGALREWYRNHLHRPEGVQ
jgi:ABC-type multidrug transport system ATPase subunit